MTGATDFEEREAAFARLRAVEWEAGEADGIVKEPIEAAAEGVLREALAVEPEPAPEASYTRRPPAVSIPLAWPFSIDGRRVSRVDIRPPSLGEVEAVGSGGMLELEMHASMAGLSVAALRAMRWSDAKLVISAARTLAPEMKRI